MTAAEGSRSPEEIEHWLLNTIGEALGIPVDSLDPTAPFTSYGLDSIAAFTITVDLAEYLERDLDASLLWEFTTIAEIAEHLGKVAG